MALYIPPPNFGMVERLLYRSGQPSELNFPFIERLELNTVIYLAPEEPSPAFQEFLNEHSIRLIHLGQDDEQGSLGSAWQSSSEKVVLKALEIILDSRYYPLHIMCHLGRHRTGTVVGCLRKVQRWNLASIFGEYRRYAGNKVRYLNEQFIELFDVDLVRAPDEAPVWIKTFI